MNKAVKNLVIITGTSRGIGFSLAKRLLGPENCLICISRQKNDALVQEATSTGCSLEYMNIDLTRSNTLEPLMSKVFERLQKECFSRLCLVNNAGMLAPVKPIGLADSSTLAANISVNIIAPIILMNLFIRYFGTYKADKRIINISSGAATSPYPGWTAYCSSKAALKMASQCIHAEQENYPHRVKVVSFAPGVVDTAMQTEIRNTDPEDFALVDRFKKLKDDGGLLSPDIVAVRISELLFNEPFPDGESLDIRK